MTTPAEKDAMALAVLDAVKAVILRRLHRYNKKANDTIKAGKVPHPDCIVQQERAAYLVDEYDTARAHLASRIAELEGELEVQREQNRLGAARELEFLDRATRAEAELAAVREDADRYRWLRDKSIGQFRHPIVVSQTKGETGMLYVGPMIGTGLDAAIDCAIDAARGAG